MHTYVRSVNVVNVTQN